MVVLVAGYNKHLFFLSLALVLLVVACQSSTEKTLFVDLASSHTGIFFENSLSYSEEFNMIDYLYYYDGGGVALGDINNDGMVDIYLVSNEGDNALYLNLGEMKFKEISESAGVRSPGSWKTGVSMVDINGDGLLDIYQCRLGNYKGITGKNELYINQGDLTFVEEAANYNLDFSGFATQTAFFDMDNDGDLDAYLLNHSVHSSNSFGDTSLRAAVDSLSGDRLYRNDNNFFVDISAQSGIYQSTLGYGLGIGLSDINRDGFTDIFVANDFMENDFLYLNNQDETFTEVYQQMADYTSLSSMGCDLSDFNNDGLVDIITLDMLPKEESIRKASVGEDPLEIFKMKVKMGFMPQYKRNMLQLNRGDGTFSDIAMMAGVHATDWSWAPLFADFDNDGWKDLFISNGIIGRPNDLEYLKFISSDQVINKPDLPDSALYNRMPSGTVSNFFYRNNGDLTFEDMSKPWGTLPFLTTQGAAYGDLDNDGDLDLVLNNLDHQAVIKENTTDRISNHYLGFRLIGEKQNINAIGAKIELYGGGKYQYLEHYPVRGFKSSVDNRLHFGLGKEQVIDSLIIEWPGGAISKQQMVASDQVLEVRHPGARGLQRTKLIKHPMFVQVANSALGIGFVHRENNFVEFNREPLIPHMHSQEGPALAIGDLNADGKHDFFVGGAKHQPGSIYLQTSEGFNLSQQIALEADKISEDVAADLFDFDKDGDNDLLVVSGGNEFRGNSEHRKPRLYLNDGTGKLTRAPNAIKEVFQTGSCLAVHDFDGDGWQDVFLGTQVEPWNYGTKPKSYLLKNEGGKKFVDVSFLLPENGRLGMVNDATWIDFEGKGRQTLVVVGEWMEILMISLGTSSSEIATIPESSGFWKSIESIDYDKDGDQDLLVGNLGLNSKLKANKSNPMHLYLHDFDQNGTLDPVMTLSKNGEEYVFNTQVQLARQIPSFNSSFLTKQPFPVVSPSDLIGNGLTDAVKLTVSELRSGIYLNTEDGFQFKPVPNQMQLSTIRDFLVADLSGDDSMEVLSTGNMFPASSQEGRYAASRGALLLGFPDNPQVKSNGLTGLSARGDTRGAKQIKFQEQDYLIVARNNDSLLWFKPNRP